MSSALGLTTASNNPMHLSIRFQALPDLLLPITSPSTTTVVQLKHLIRSSLSPPTSTQSFRLIHAGKSLKDADVLSAVLKAPPPPPRASPDDDPKGKGKGKEKAADLPLPRVYIHCVLGDELSSAELEAETAAATKPTSPLTSSSPGTSRFGSLSRSAQDGASSSATGAGARAGASHQTSSTTPAPRGFERLLTAGFTPSEVNQLRLQFRSIQSNIHTPETMPSPSTLLTMEDAWIDDNAGATGGTAGGGGVGAGGGFDFGDDGGLGGGALDDLLWGNIMGFLWPLGCIGFVIREGGVWSRRRSIAVVTGFMLSITFGLLRVIS